VILPLFACLLHTRRLVAQIRVTPDGGSAIVPQNSTEKTVTFTLYTGVGSQTWHVSPDCSGVVTNCWAPNGYDVTFQYGTSVDIKFSTPSAGSGRIKLTASRLGVSDTGWFNVTVDGTPPTITLLQPRGDVDIQYPTIQIGWCDDGSLDAASRSITVNSSDKTSSFDYVSGGPQACAVTATSTTNSVALSVGSNTLVARICDAVANCATTNFSITRLSYGVAVTPDGTIAPQRPANTSGYSENFTVQNTGTAQNTYSLSCGGSSNLTCTGLTIDGSPASSVSLAGDSSKTVVGSYNVGAVGTGTLSLTATGTNASDGGSYSVPVVTPNPQPPVVDVTTVNPGATVERDLCLTIAAGSAAAYECGDLRIVHPLPTTRTLNKARTPTLLYNSAAAHPFPLVAANVTLPAGATPPDSVVATLRFGAVFKGRGAWAGSSWGPGATRRIVVGYDALNDTTGIYTYTLEVVNHYSDRTPGSTVTGELVIVNRAYSPFGAGWWIAGLERLNVSNMMWVGGDGSVRRYQVVTTNVWAAPNVDRPDTLKKIGSEYVRTLPHGVQVWFDANGKHVRTVNRLGHTTTFAYLGTTDTLSSIALPPAGSGKIYQFAYANGRLQTVTAPPAGSTSRITTLTDPAGQVTGIRGPDTYSVGFGYDPGVANRIISRTDRRGSLTTYQYDSGYRLSQTEVHMIGPNIVSTFRALESIGLTTATDTAAAYTRLDGPRTDVLDTTAFWLERFGAPRRIVNALGFETILTRGNATFPALVTKVRYPNGRVVTATYDGRGNIMSSTDSSVAPQNGKYATTRFVSNTKWDFDSIIAPPEGDSIVMSYNDTNGNRLWQQDARGSISRVEFAYYSADSVNGLLRSMRTPSQAWSSPRDSVEYDRLGNLSRTKTPLGFWTTHYTDAIGRDTLIQSPVDSAQTLWTTDTIRYDLADREMLRKTVGPAVSYQTLYSPLRNVAAQTVGVSSFYDPEGDLDSLLRWRFPNPNNIDTLRTSWRYDPANRKVKELAVDGRADSIVYDPAGNPIETVTRRGHSIAMSYDALNQLVRRIVPQVTYPESTVNFGPGPVSFPLYTVGLTLPKDTATFAYDSVGDIVHANNRDAWISRHYNPNGTIASDTLFVRRWLGADTAHIYGLRFGYDLNGRRTWLKHPFPIAARVAGTPKDSTAYAYQSFGALGSVTDVLGNPFRLFYDVEGRLDSLEFPGQVYEKRSYDADGRLSRRVERAYYTWPRGDSGFVRDTIRHEIMSYDARGKLLRERTLSSTQTNPVFDSTVVWYSGLGSAVAAQQWDGKALDTPVWFVEQFEPDALGDIGWSRVYRNTTNQIDCCDSIQTRYNAQTGRMVRRWWYAGFQSPDSTLFDESGNSRIVLRQHWDADYGLWEPAITAEYYGADNRLRVLDRRTTCCRIGGRSAETLTAGGFEEYRYDALGRRIAFRVRRDSTCFDQCARAPSTIERTVWDGDQVLYEMRYPGGDNVSSADLERDTATIVLYSAPYAYGRTIYTHGPGIDDPIDVIRVGYTTFDSTTWAGPVAIIPHRNWRGDYDVGSFDNGTYTRCTKLPSGQNSGVCVVIDWPAFNKTVYIGDRHPGDPVSWMGHLLGNRRDASGQLYMRNRYYDPVQGRFTQEDPIGLAGGLNLYGFANGDPVTFSDPFGLQSDPCEGRLTSAVWYCINRRTEPWIPIIQTAWTIESIVTPMGEAAVGSGAIGGEIGQTIRAFRAGRLAARDAELAGRAVLVQQGARVLTLSRHAFSGSKWSAAYHDFGAAGLNPLEVARAVAEKIGDLSELSPGIGRGSVEVGGQLVKFRTWTLETGETIVNFFLR